MFAWIFQVARYRCCRVAPRRYYRVGSTPLAAFGARPYKASSATMALEAPVRADRRP